MDLITDANMAHVRKIDFAKGFDRFHIIWPLKDFQHRESPNFSTPTTNGDQKVDFKWSLVIGKCTQPDKPLFSLELVSAPANAVLPIIFRVSVLCDGKTEPMCNATWIIPFRLSTSRGYPLPNDKIPTASDGDFRFHCWIDIPKAAIADLDAVGVENATVANSVQQEGILELSTGITDLFASVIDPNPCPMSDVTLVIMKPPANGITNSKSIRPRIGRRSDDVERQFYCSKAILAVRSPVFRRMFSNPEWTEYQRRGGGSRFQRQ